jgi:hypothetical protein
VALRLKQQGHEAANLLAVLPDEEVPTPHDGQTVEYAILQGVQRWTMFGDPEGWWPIYTQAGPVSPPRPPRERVDITLHR